MYASCKCQMLSNTVSGRITSELDTLFMKHSLRMRDVEAPLCSA